MKKITTWSPDTCRCVIEFAWDTDDPQESRTHHVISHVGCLHHQELRGVPLTEHHVHAENVKKNTALCLVAEQAGLPFDEIKFSHDEQRGLHLTVKLGERLGVVSKHLADNGHGDVVLHDG